MSKLRKIVFILILFVLFVLPFTACYSSKKSGAKGKPYPAEAKKSMRAMDRSTMAKEEIAAAPPSADREKPQAPGEEGDPKPDFDTEEYDRIYENPFLEVQKNPLSTFSIDVDTASYANVRRFLRSGSLPRPDAVRIEEMVNYFSYSYPEPTGEDPFSFTTEYSNCPWNPENKLLHIGLQSKKIDLKDLPPANLVFLLDVSGSMMNDNKLPLLKKSLKLLLGQMREEDRIAITVYAGAAGVVLDSTSAAKSQKIIEALDSLSAGGSTAGGEGIKLAYKIAKKNFIKNGNNRIILATDGDFNVGPSSDADLIRMIEDKRKDGIFLTVLGFGMGNYKDSKMEKLADKGNGNYAYIDTLLEARKVLVEDLGGTLLTIAKDVKIQIEFNPAKVASYRLIGYENRVMAAEDFDDDTKDAGELGAGHTVTALYEIKEADGSGSGHDLKYQETKVKDSASASNELATIKFRYKKPDGDKSTLLTFPIPEKVLPQEAVSENFIFSAAVAEFGMLLRDSKHKGNSSYEQVQELAQKGRGQDPQGLRGEFIQLVLTARDLAATK